MARAWRADGILREGVSEMQIFHPEFLSAVPILVFLAGVLLMPVSAHAQTTLEVEKHVTQKENETAFVFKVQGAGGGSITGRFNWEVEAAISSAHSNSG